MKAADYAELVLRMAPQGGTVSRCTPEGEPFLAPGTFHVLVPAVVLDEAEVPNLVRIRFGPPAGFPVVGGAAFSTYTRTPWTQLPGGTWVLPSFTSDGEPDGFVRFVPSATQPPIATEPDPT